MDDTLDLTFAPAIKRHGRRLTAEQIAHYNREGFVSGLNVFTAKDVDANRAYFDRLLASRPDGAYAINCYQGRAQGIWDLCTHPRILDLVEDIIGPNIICWASHFFCKVPGDPKPVPWHQDAIYWHLAPARTATVWLAIDDADQGNGAMRFLPRSHDKGALPVRSAGQDAVLGLETVGANALGAPISNTLRAGQVSLHADMLVHGSLPNRSNRRRCGLTLRYCPPEVRFTDEAWADRVEAILCRGTGTPHWRHHPRPLGDDVSPENSPLNVGGN
ncbi:MAG: phytanoyl-CoA dioxygenase family protein [Pseudomonadota bacterium]